VVFWVADSISLPASVEKPVPARFEFLAILADKTIPTGGMTAFLQYAGTPGWLG